MTFKNVKNIVSHPVKVNHEPVLVHKIAGVGEWIELNPPRMSNELSCLSCGGYENFTPIMFPEKNDEKVWMCANRLCLTMATNSLPHGVSVPTTSKRAIEWPLFCELNGLGDVCHDVKFEKIDQSTQKIAFMRKFLERPNGMIIMQGKPGRGKTFCALGMCEFWTRKSSSCIFISAKTVQENFKNDDTKGFLNKLISPQLLVIDDFGLVEPSPSYMSYIQEIIDKRLQWKNRGTIITTNLVDDKLTEYCGQQLVDRLEVGQKFIFNNESRRVNKPL